MKTYSLNYQYVHGNSFILRTNYMEDLAARIDGKLYVHRHFDFHFSYVLKLLGLIRAIFYFSTSDSLSVDVIFCFCQI